jgi:membrane fusion protein (multidrug efflux system)
MITTETPKNGNGQATVALAPSRTIPPAADGSPAPASGASADEKAPSGKRRWIIVLGSAAGLIVAAIGVSVFIDSLHYETTDDAYLESHVVPITPQVSGRIGRVEVRDNLVVRKGDLLVELDPADYQAALDQARGAEESSKGKLLQAETGITVARATRDQVKAEGESVQSTFENAVSDLRRYEALDERARSRQRYDVAIAAEKAARAQVAQVEAKLATAEAQIATAISVTDAARGDLAKSSADVRRAELNLGYTRIVAPMDGRVTKKNVEPGAYVSIGQPLFALVSPEVWVTANFKETQLTHMRPGQSVEVVVDAYPGRTFKGEVDSIQAGTGGRFSVLPAENATGNFVKVVQRVPVKILMDPAQTGDPSLALAPGMSVEPKVRVR